jgi:hypothetical protein
MEMRGSGVAPARAAPANGEGGAARAMEEERGIFLRESRDGSEPEISFTAIREAVSCDANGDRLTMHSTVRTPQIGHRTPKRRS